MFETKRYDADGNLIEVISAEVCTNMFWHQFGEALTIPAHQIDMKTGARGQFHLVPPKHKPLARYCFRANVEELQQCRRLSYRDKHLKPQREVQCASCGITYLSSKKNAKFCENKKCNGAALLRQATAKGRTINCNYCGFEFIAPRKGNQKFCIMPYFVNTLQCSTISTKQRKRNKALKKLPK